MEYSSSMELVPVDLTLMSSIKMSLSSKMNPNSLLWILKNSSLKSETSRPATMMDDSMPLNLRFRNFSNLMFSSLYPVLVDQNGVNVQDLGDLNSVLTTGTTERNQSMVGDLETLRLCDLTDRSGHGFIGHFDEPQCDLRDCQVGAVVLVDNLCELFKLLQSGFLVKRHVLVWPEDLWEILRKQSAQSQVGIGDSQWPILTVTSRTRVRTCRFRPDFEQMVLPKQHRPTTSSHGLDVQLWSLDDHTVQVGLEDMLQRASVSGDIRRSTTGVVVDRWCVVVRSLSTPNNTTGWPRENTVDTGELLVVDQPTVRLHELDLSGDWLLGVGLLDDSDGLATQRPNKVHPIGFGGLHLTVFGEIFQSDSFIDLNNMFVQNSRLLNVQGKDVRSGLVTNEQRVSEPLSRNQGTSLTFSFKKGIRGNSGPHSNRFNQSGVQGFVLRVRLLGELLQ
ncbi:hypothetical protein WICPIJ_002106 [Wickerhamomyces pijperi]|uniref:Uncharacterized protein n=1 Tax=Wickerhamomyces pijperi TaxID=599730 RepID=A0A9P8TQ54_WICPI|nr:hypothetical protein WICPIJ_002106 [Wickerhamomyces pijperi]